MASKSHITTGDISRATGCSEWMVRRAIERGFLAQPQRIGLWRVFPVEQLPEIKAALRRAGYLAAEEVASA